MGEANYYSLVDGFTLRACNFKKLSNAYQANTYQGIISNCSPLIISCLMDNTPNVSGNKKRKSTKLFVARCTLLFYTGNNVKSASSNGSAFSLHYKNVNNTVIISHISFASLL